MIIGGSSTVLIECAITKIPFILIDSYSGNYKNLSEFFTKKPLDPLIIDSEDDIEAKIKIGFSEIYLEKLLIIYLIRTKRRQNKACFSIIIFY